MNSAPIIAYSSFMACPIWYSCPTIGGAVRPLYSKKNRPGVRGDFFYLIFRLLFQYSVALSVYLQQVQPGRQLAKINLCTFVADARGLRWQHLAYGSNHTQG